MDLSGLANAIKTQGNGKEVQKAEELRARWEKSLARRQGFEERLRREEVAQFKAAQVKAELKAKGKPEKKKRGYVPREVQQLVFKRDGHTCQFCGATKVKLQISHLVTPSQGVNNKMKNLTTACIPCNVKKGSKTWKLGKVGPIDKQSYNYYRHQYGLPPLGE